MEPVSLALGAVGIFGVCIDLFHRYETFKEAEESQPQCYIRLRAEKIRLKRWANAVGLSSSGLCQRHNAQLDNADVHNVVSGTLIFLGKALDSEDERVAAIQKEFEGRDPYVVFDTMKIVKKGRDKPLATQSKRNGLGWAFGGRERLMRRLDDVKSAVDTLYEMVDPNEGVTNGVESQTTGLKARHIRGSLGLEKQFSGIDTLLRQFDIAKARDEGRMIVEWLGIEDSDQRYEELLETRLAGTCDWLRQTSAFKRWSPHESRIDSPGLLWIHGPAGFGKSVLCAHIVQGLKSKNRFSVVHSFVSTSQSRQNPDVVVRQWLLQLTRTRSDVRQIILDLMRSDSARVASCGDVWTALQTMILQGFRGIFVLDGMDEYDEISGQRRSFLQKMKIVFSNGHCRVLLMSRDEWDIRQELSSQPDSGSSLSLSNYKITALDVRSDTMVFAQSVVRQKLPGRDVRTQNDLARRMAEKSAGMFLWIKLQQSELRSMQPLKALRWAIASTPSELGKAYESRRALISDFSNERRDRAGRIFAWVMYAFRPLRACELADFLDSESSQNWLVDLEPDSNVETCSDNEVDYEETVDVDQLYVDQEILGPCGSLLESRVSDEAESAKDQTIHLAHFSVKQYLLSLVATTRQYGRDSTWTDLLEESTAHTYLAKACIRQMLKPDFLHLPNVPRGEKDSRGCFLDYAIGSWYKHVQTSRTYDAQLRDLLEAFLNTSSPSFVFWQKRFEAVSEHVEPAYFVKESRLGSPFYYAALFGIVEIMDLLHQKCGTIINSEGGYYGTPLGAAFAAGHEQVFALLLDWDVDISQESGVCGSAINAAAAKGRSSMVTRLLSAGADVRIKDCMDRTTLDIACMYDRLDVAKQILEARAENAAPSSYDSAPLYLAAMNGSMEVVGLLLDRGVDLATARPGGWTPLHAAADGGHIEVVQLLLDKGADITLASSNGWTALNLAANKGHMDMMQLLLDRGADVAIASLNGWTPLNSAADSGHIEVVQLLLDKGANMAIAESNGWTPLHSAVRNGHIEVVQLLLDQGADIAIADSSGWTALHAAVHSGHIEVVQLLLDKGANINTNNSTGWTSLSSAAHNGHTELVQLLLDRGADVTTATLSGWTSLNLAAHNGHIDVMQLLLDKGADVTTTNSSGWTPLSSAARNGHIKPVQLLLDRGADITTADLNGWTPLNSAAGSGQIEAVQLLLDKGADITVANSSGWTPLNSAAYIGHIGVVQRLLDRGADPSAGNSSGWTPLSSAANEGHIELVQLLLDKGADITTADSSGWTPLISAASSGHAKVVQLLLEKGADINIANSYGWSPLHSASDGGHVEAVQVLLDNGSKTAMTSSGGCTPLHFAARSGHVEVVRLLLERGADIAPANFRGWSPLDWAATNGHEAIADLLYNKDTNSCATDSGGSISQVMPFLRLICLIWLNASVLVALGYFSHADLLCFILASLF